MNHFHSPVFQTNQAVGRYTPSDNDNDNDNEEGDGGGWNEELQKISRRSRHMSSHGNRTWMNDFDLLGTGGGSVAAHSVNGRSADARNRLSAPSRNVSDGRVANEDSMDRLWYPRLEQDDYGDIDDDTDEFASDSMDDCRSGQGVATAVGSHDDDVFGRSLQNDWLHYSSSSATAAGGFDSSSLSSSATVVDAGIGSPNSRARFVPPSAYSSVGSFPFYPQSSCQPTIHKHRR